MPRSACEHSLGRHVQQCGHYPEPRGPCPLTQKHSCRNLLGEEGRETQARDAAFSVIISMFCHKTSILELFSKGLEHFVPLENLLRSRTGVGRPRRSKSSTCSYVSIDQHASVHTASHLMLRGAADSHGLQGGRRSEVRTERGPSRVCLHASWF